MLDLMAIFLIIFQTLTFCCGQKNRDQTAQIKFKFEEKSRCYLEKYEILPCVQEAVTHFI